MRKHLILTLAVLLIGSTSGQAAPMFLHKMASKCAWLLGFARPDEFIYLRALMALPPEQRAEKISSMSFLAGQVLIDQVLDLADRTSFKPEQKAAALDALPVIGMMKFTQAKALFKGHANADVNGYLMDVVDRLIKIIERNADKEVQLLAATVMGQYVDHNTNGGSSGLLILARRGPEAMVQIVENYDLDDDVRALVHRDEVRLMQGVFPDYNPKFLSSAELRKRDVINFLGKARRELTAKQVSTAESVERVFPQKNDKEKIEIFNDWMAEGKLPEKYHVEVILKQHFGNLNDVRSLAWIGILKQEDDYDKSQMVFTSRFGGVVRVNDMDGSQLLRNFSKEEQWLIRRALLGLHDINLGDVSEH